MTPAAFDALPHYFWKIVERGRGLIDAKRTSIEALWWGVNLGENTRSLGVPCFRRHPGSQITIGPGCTFRSSALSNLIGVNRPCIISTLGRGAEIVVGAGCGFSGTVIGAATKISLGDNVRCGANTQITDTDWHFADPRTGPGAPVSVADGVWLGVNVTVLKGVSIGENTVVGAGSIVTNSLPDNVYAGGNPARVIRALTGQPELDLK